MCKISQHSWTRQQGFGIDICVRRTQNAETDLDYRVNKHKNSNIYAYDYCKINVKYKLSDQIRHFPQTNLPTRCRWTMVVISPECCITIALNYMYIYINCDCTNYMRWICVNGPWLSNFESS